MGRVKGTFVPGAAWHGPLGSTGYYIGDRQRAYEFTETTAPGTFQ